MFRKLLIYHPVAVNRPKANVVQVRNMVKSFHKNGLECHYAGFMTKKDSTVIEDFNLNWGSFLKSSCLIATNRHKGFGKFHTSFLAAYFVVHRIIREEKIDLVFTRSNALLTFLRFFSSNVKVILELHNYKLAGPNILDRFYLKSLGNRKLDVQVVVISQALKDYFVDNGVPEERIVVQHDGVDPSLRIRVENRSNLADLPFTSQQPLVTYAGSLYKDRKIDRIVQLSLKFSNLNFLVLGGNEDEIKLITKKFDRLPSNIYFAGRVPAKDVYEWLELSDILLALWSWDVPTMKYCSPLKVFEYLLTGKIMVVEAYPTIVEVLKEEHAVLVEPENLDELIKAIEVATEKLRNGDLPRHNIELVQRHYTWDQRAYEILRSSEKT